MSDIRVGDRVQFSHMSHFDNVLRTITGIVLYLSREVSDFSLIDADPNDVCACRWWVRTEKLTRTPALDTLVDGDVLAAAMGALE